MKRKHIMIAGGGASGMAAAIAAARMGAEVTILEHNNMLGKKILSTGNGKCNFSNLRMEASCFRGASPAVIETVLTHFGVQAALQFFYSLGVVSKERNGYLYPRTGQAATILEVLKMELERLHIAVVLETQVLSAEKKQNEFWVHTTKGVYRGDAFILSTGGKAAPALGADGSGYDLAKAFGHTIVPVVPALVQLMSSEPYFKRLAGVRAEAGVTVFIDGKAEAADIGELQLTKTGISGIPVFQISRFAAKALQEKKEVAVEIDFVPGMNEPAFAEFLEERVQLQGTKNAEGFLLGIFHQKLIPVILERANIPLQKVCSSFTKTDHMQMIDACKHFHVPVTCTTGFEQAQVCAGGVCTTQWNAYRMESELVRGLFLTGELLDVDGICGGYNLQWAWATGCLAGTYAAAKEN